MPVVSWWHLLVSCSFHGAKKYMAEHLMTKVQNINDSKLSWNNRNRYDKEYSISKPTVATKFSSLFALPYKMSLQQHHHFTLRVKKISNFAGMKFMFSWTSIVMMNNSSNHENLHFGENHTKWQLQLQLHYINTIIKHA